MILLPVLTTFTLIIALQQMMIPFVSGEAVGALYMMTNGGDKNEIIVTSIEADGTLKEHKRVEIPNGKGLGKPASLHSANSIVVSGNFLFNVNFGSNSVSSFTIDPNDPTIITHKSTEKSGGAGPSCLAYSSKLNLLCVVNGGNVSLSGVFCLKVGADGTLTNLPSKIQPFNISTLALPLPNPGFGSPSDILFTHKDDKYITVSIKGIVVEGKGVTQPGYVLNFPVNGGQLGHPIKNTMGIVPYAMNIMNPGEGNIIGYTEPGRGEYRIMEFKDGEKHCSKGVKLEGQENICWNCISKKSKNLYVIDASDKTKKGVITELKYSTSPISVEFVEKHKENIEEILLDCTIVSLPTADFLYVVHVDMPGSKISNGKNQGIYIVQIDGAGPNGMKSLSPYYPIAPNDLPNTILGMAHKLK